MPRFHNLASVLAHDHNFRHFATALSGGGTSGHDHLNGTSGANVLSAGGGDDDVAGMAGRDTSRLAANPDDASLIRIRSLRRLQFCGREWRTSESRRLPPPLYGSSSVSQ
jgi:hypothetical protein